MAVDYLKTYLGIDPDDYSSMEARIRGEEPQAQAPVMMRQPMMMPQQRSLGEMEAMPMAPRPQPKPQVDDRYQSLMDEIASLKAQIEGMQAPTEQVATEQAPVMADEPVSPSLPEGVDAGGRFFTGPNGENMYQPPMPKIGPGQFQAQVMPTPINLDTGMPINTSLPILNNRLKTEPYQAPPELQNRMVDEPQKLPPAPPPTRVIHRGPTGSVEIYDDNLRPPEPDMSDKFSIKRTTQAPSQDIQSSIDYLAKLPKMNIPQIPDIEQIRQKMEEANMTFPEPVSYQDQLQSIRDLLAMNQMPQQMPQPMQELRAGEIMPNSPVVDTRSFPRIPGPLAVPPGIIPNLVKKQVQQPQMQSVGRPQLPFQGGFMPEMRADGGGIDKAIYDLKFKLNG
jgi:hypothetical protein